ncbi:MAG: hypothetical protein J5758_01615, partial [Abditibacteriota bacterium]|nr:hypothetical protein [Abditibacteriota bacterium]
LCDQDDVWHRDKIKYMAQVSEKESGALLVICRYQKIKNSADISFRNPSGLYHREDNVSVGEYPGCCFCFRKSFFDRVKDARNEEAAHDLLIRMAAWMSDGIYICGDTLHYFRRHSGSATATGGWKSDAEDRKKYAGLVLDQYNALAKVIGEERVPTGYAEFLNMRYGMLKSGSAAEWFGILKYSRFYSQKKHIFADLLSILGKQNGGGEK